MLLDFVSPVGFLGSTQVQNDIKLVLAEQLNVPAQFLEKVLSKLLVDFALQVIFIDGDLSPLLTVLVLAVFVKNRVFEFPGLLVFVVAVDDHSDYPFEAYFVVTHHAPLYIIFLLRFWDRLLSAFAQFWAVGLWVVVQGIHHRFRHFEALVRRKFFSGSDYGHVVVHNRVATVFILFWASNCNLY